MIWWGVSDSSATQIHLCDPGIKINSQVYRAMLNDVLPPLKETVFTDEDECCFQQDFAPAHKVKKHKNGCKCMSQISLKQMTSPSPAQTSIVGL